MKQIKNIFTRESSPLAVDPHAAKRPYLSFRRAPALLILIARDLLGARPSLQTAIRYIFPEYFFQNGLADFFF